MGRAFAVVTAVFGVLAAITPIVTEPAKTTGIILVVFAAVILLFVGIALFCAHRKRKITVSVGVVIGLVILFVAAGTGAGYALWQLGSIHRIKPCCPPIAVSIAVGSEDLDLFNGSHAQSYFLKHHFQVTPTGFGSFAIAHVEKKSYDLALPSSQVATDALEGPGAPYPSRPMFTTPLVILTWKPLIPLLETLHIASPNADGMWTFDIASYLATDNAGIHWNEIQGNTFYNNPNQVQLRMTDPRESNSGAMFVAAASYVINHHQVIASLSQRDDAAAQLHRLFQHLGSQPRTTRDVFEEYLNGGPSAVPLVLSYESLFVGKKLADPSEMPPDAVMMYTDPVVNSYHNIVSFNGANGRSFYQFVTSDSTLKTIAENDYGFRAEPQFVDDMRRRGITVTSGLPAIPIPDITILKDLTHAIKK